MSHIISLYTAFLYTIKITHKKCPIHYDVSNFPLESYLGRTGMMGLP